MGFLPLPGKAFFFSKKRRVKQLLSKTCSSAIQLVNFDVYGAYFCCQTSFSFWNAKLCTIFQSPMSLWNDYRNKKFLLKPGSDNGIYTICLFSGSCISHPIEYVVAPFQIPFKRRCITYHTVRHQNLFGGNYNKILAVCSDIAFIKRVLLISLLPLLQCISGCEAPKSVVVFVEVIPTEHLNIDK